MVHLLLRGFYIGFPGPVTWSIEWTGTVCSIYNWTLLFYLCIFLSYWRFLNLFNGSFSAVFLTPDKALDKKCENLPSACIKCWGCTCWRHLLRKPLYLKCQMRLFNRYTCIYTYLYISWKKFWLILVIVNLCFLHFRQRRSVYSLHVSTLHSSYGYYLFSCFI